MKLFDNGANLDLMILKNAADFESTQAMFSEGQRYERQAGRSALAGIVTTAAGAAISRAAGKHERLAPLGKGVMLGGMLGMVVAGIEWSIHDDLQHGAGMIELRVAEGTARILPEGKV